MRELDWDVLPYPPYSPDLAPSNYRLFRILERYLRGENFESAEHIKTSLLQFFEQKGQKFFKKNIQNFFFFYSFWIKDGKMSSSWTKWTIQYWPKNRLLYIIYDWNTVWNTTGLSFQPNSIAQLVSECVSDIKKRWKV